MAVRQKFTFMSLLSVRKFNVPVQKGKSGFQQEPDTAHCSFSHLAGITSFKLYVPEVRHRYTLWLYVKTGSKSRFFWMVLQGWITRAVTAASAYSS